MKIYLSVLLIVTMGMSPGLRAMQGFNMVVNDDNQLPLFKAVDDLYQIYVNQEGGKKLDSTPKEEALAAGVKVARSAFKDCVLDTIFSKKICDSNDVNYFRCISLWLRFLTLYEEKNVRIKNKTKDNEARHYLNIFDQWVGLRLECAESLDAVSYLLLQPRKTTAAPFLSEKIINFGPLSISRWNPFGWGNWYDRLHRQITNSPSWPWNEGVAEDRIIIRDHLKDIQTAIGRNKDSAAILEIYFMVMQELRLLINKNRGNTGRNILRTVGAVGAIGLGALAWRYFFGNKKSGSQLSKNYSPTKELKNLSIEKKMYGLGKFAR